MQMPTTARLLGRSESYFRMETPSDLCAVCRLVEKANPSDGFLFNDLQTVENELKDARRPFPPTHYAVNKGLETAVARLKQLHVVGAI